MSIIVKYRRALAAAALAEQQCGTADARRFWRARQAQLRRDLSTLTCGRVRWS